MRFSTWRIVGLVVAATVLAFYGTSLYADPHPHGNNGGSGGAGGSSTVTTTVNNTANGGSATSTGGSAVVGNTSSSSTVGNVTSGASSSTASTGVVSQSVGGDDVRVYGHSSAPAAEGTSSVSLGTLIGGISVAHTEAYVKIRGHIAELVSLHNSGLVGDDGVLTSAEWANDYRKSIKRLSHVSRRGERTLMNLFGIIR